MDRSQSPTPSLHPAVSGRRVLSSLALLLGVLGLSANIAAQQCTGLCLKQGCTTSSGTVSSSTSITGTVFTPNGTDPLPNAVVFVPNAALPPLNTGTVQCIPSGSPVGGSPIVGAYTDYRGQFTITNVPVGVSFPLVVQAGKWRSKVIVPAITTCGSTTTVNISFPTTQTASDTDDNIPLIAVATGNVDAAECVLRKVGLTDLSLYSDPSGTGRVRFYTGTKSAGAKIDSATPTEAQLMTTDLNNYDMVMFPCQGGPSASISATTYANLLAYANAGGRVFATHWSEGWLNNNSTNGAPGAGTLTSPFVSSATWVTEASIGGANTSIPATIDLTSGITDIQTISQWLSYIGVDTTPGIIPGLSSTFKDVSAVASTSQTWLTLNDPSSAAGNNAIMQFTFNTPVNASSTTQCGRVLYNDYHVEVPTTAAQGNTGFFPTECDTSAMSAQEKLLEYSLFDLSTFIQPAGPPVITLGMSNSPSSFTDGDAADTLTLNVTNTSTTNPSNPSLTVNVTLPTGLTATAMTDASGGNWICNPATVSCTRLSGLDANTSDSITLTVSVAPSTPPPSVTVTGTVSGGGLTTNVTATDTIPLIGVPIVTWPTPAPITYGTALSSTQLDATANVPGIFVYSPVAGTVLSPGTQTLSSVFTATDAVNYPAPVTTSVSLSVTQIPQSIIFSTLTSQVTYGVGPLALSATGGASGNPVTFSATGPATVSGNNLIITGAGTVVVTANQAGNVTYAAAPSVSQTITVLPATLTVTAASPTIVYGSAVPAYTAGITGYVNGDSSAVVSGAPSLTTTPATPSAAGTYPITAALGTLAAANYTFTFVNGTLTITQASQSISFTAASPVTYGIAPITLNATGGGSGDPVTYTVLSGPGTVSGSTLSITGVGTVVVAANQAANANYTAATQVTQSILVNPATLTVTAASPTIAYGSALPAYTATISGFVYSDTSAVVSGAPSLTTTPATPSAAGTYPITAALGTLAAANYNFIFAGGTLTITQAVQTISFTLASPVNYGVAPITLTATGGASGNAVTFSLVSGPATLVGNTLSITGAGTVVVNANQAGNANYTAAATVTQTLIVNQAPQTISFTLASPVTYGVAPITLSATGGASGNPVTFSATGPGTVSGNILTITGGGTVVVTANQAGSTNYAAATPVSQTLLVNPEAQTITFTAPVSPVSYGVAPITLAATATSSLPVYFTVLSGPATVSGTTLTITGGGTVVIAADQAGSGNYSAAPEVTHTIVVNKAATVAVLSSTATTLFIQNPVVLSAVINTSTTVANAAPSGTVAFMDGGVLLGTATVDGNRNAVFTATFTTTGSHAITAVYSGDGGYAPSASTVTTETLMDFNLTAIGVTSQDVEHGSTATYTFSVSPINGAATPQDITFAVDGYPFSSVLTWSPQPLPTGSGLSTVTLTIQTPTYPTGSNSASNRSRTAPVLACVALGTLLLLPLSRRLRGKQMRRLVCALVLLAGAGGLTGLSGCGSGWQHENFTLTISATSGGLSHYAVDTLRVH